jgi:hypothetical protein
MLFVFNSDAEREAWAAFPAVKAVLDTTPLRTYLEWAVDDGARFYLPVLAPEESLHWVPCLHKREARGWSAERGRAVIVGRWWVMGHGMDDATSESQYRTLCVPACRVHVPPGSVRH